MTRFVIRLVAVWCLSFGGLSRAAEPHPSLPKPVIPDCLGVNIHFTDPKPGEMEMIAAAGFKWVRMDLAWAATERKKGEYDFAAYDRLVAALDRHQMRAIFILDYGNALYAEAGDKHPFTSRAGTEEFRAAYARWAAAAVTHFQKRGYLWELWNEPNHKGFWKPEPDAAQYAALALAAAKAIRAAAPGEALIGPATSTIDLPFLETCFQAGMLEYLDAVSVHPYRQTAPETVEDEYRRLRQLIGKYAPKDKVIPVVSGEWGYSTAWKDFSDERQGEYLPRQLLTNLANDVALSIWYDWHDDGTNPKDAEHRFGIVRHDYHGGRDPVYDPKPAYTAMKTLTGQLRGFRFDKQLLPFRRDGIPSVISYSRNDIVRRVLESGTVERWEDEARVLLFTKEDEVRIVAWDSAGRHRAPRPWLVPSSAGKIRAASLAGPDREMEAGADGLPFDFTGMPEVLKREKPNAMWRIAAGWTRAPLDCVARLGSDAKASERTLRNPLDQPLHTPDNMVFLPLPASKPKPMPPGGSRSYTIAHRPTGGAAIHRSMERQVVQIGEEPAQTLIQPVTTIVTNPISMYPLPAGPDFLPVQIENPSGEAFEGWLTWEVDQWTKTQEAISLAPGEKEKIVRVRPPKGATLGRSFHLILSSKPDAAKLLDIVVRTQLVEGFAGPAGGFVILADGDASVKSVQSLVEGQPPEGLPPGATSALKLTYRFEKGWKFLRVAPPSANVRMEVMSSTGITSDPWAFGMWVHSDGRGCATRIRFTDKTGQVFQASGPSLTWKGWRFVRFPLAEEGYPGIGHWGGANDGKIQLPIKWDTIFLLDNVSREPLEGDIYLSAPVLIN